MDGRERTMPGFVLVVECPHPLPLPGAAAFNCLMAAEPHEHTRTYFLGMLARELELRGMSVTLKRSPPSLRVTDPEAAMFSETLDCVSLPDGWFYRWSWGDLVERVEDPSKAADRILRVFGG